MQKSIGMVSRVLRRQGLHLLAFGFVAGFKKQQPDLPVIEAVRQFQHHFNIKDEDWQSDSIIREVNRMTLEYLQDGI